MKRIEITDHNVVDLDAIYLFVYSRVAENEMWPTKACLITMKDGDLLFWETEIKPDPNWPQGDRFGPFNDSESALEASQVALKLNALLVCMSGGLVISPSSMSDTNLISKLLDLDVVDPSASFEITDEDDLTEQQKADHKELLMAAADFHQADMNSLIEELTGG